MAKTLSSKISDPRPRINVTLATDDDRITAQLTKGYVNVQRGVKTAILRVPYGEVTELVDLLNTAADVLEKNGYDTNAPEAEDATDPEAQPETQAAA